uniref:Uncharacterized protein n=1 Tax=Psilocybe cubensis TaxID=181762 RepID=A0A8H7XZP7_PSICU
MRGTTSSAPKILKISALKVWFEPVQTRFCQGGSMPEPRTKPTETLAEPELDQTRTVGLVRPVLGSCISSEPNFGIPISMYI